MRRVIRLLILAAVAWAVWALIRQLLDQPDETRSPAGTRSEPPAPEPKPSDAARGNGTGGPSKAELYREAQALEIKGRSKMSKDELAAAVAGAASRSGVT